MNFASDNVAGAAPGVIEAVMRANAGAAPAYGNDEATRRVERLVGDLFGRDCAVFLVATGGAANALALAAMTPPWGAVFGHAECHAQVDECGGPEFFSGGARIVGLPGRHALIDAGELDARLSRGPWRPPHSVQPAAVTITQATELGTLYGPGDVAAIAEVARRHGLGLHMDGARFGNAVARLGCAPADITWRAGVDMLSLGLTKTGALMAEAVVVFDPARAETLAHRRKRAGHLVSKHRFLAVQVEAMLEDGLWLRLAAHANAMADRLAAGLARLGVRAAAPVEANLVFARLPHDMDARLKAAGALYYPWPSAAVDPGEGDPVRLACSFATTAEDVDRLLATAGG